MSAGAIAAVITAAAGLVTAVVALLRQLRTDKVMAAHIIGHAKAARDARQPRPGP